MKVKVTITTEDGELLDQLVLPVEDNDYPSEGSLARAVVETLEGRYFMEES